MVIKDGYGALLFQTWPTVTQSLSVQHRPHRHSVCNSAWPSLRGWRNEYQPKGGDACGWGVKAGMVCVLVAGKTVIPLLHTGHIW